MAAVTVREAGPSNDKDAAGLAHNWYFVGSLSEELGVVLASVSPGSELRDGSWFGSEPDGEFDWKPDCGTPVEPRYSVVDVWPYATKGTTTRSETAKQVTIPPTRRNVLDRFIDLVSTYSRSQ